MKKTAIAMLAVFMLGLVANVQAQEAQPRKDMRGPQHGMMDKKGPGRHGMPGPGMMPPGPEMRAEFKAKMQEEKALHEKYAAATTDAQKKEIEAVIKTHVEKDSQERIDMFQKRVDDSEKRLKEAKKKLAEIKKDKKKFDAKRVDNIKAGKFPEFKRCEGDNCPDMKGKRWERGERGMKPAQSVSPSTSQPTAK